MNGPSLQTARVGSLTIRVLIVEDNDHDLYLLSSRLRSCNGPFFELLTAQSLMECEKRLSEGQCDFILLDLGLPDAGGLEALFFVRQHFPKIPVLVMTSSDTGEVARRSLEAGAEIFAQKDLVHTALIGPFIGYAFELLQNARKERDLIQLDTQNREIDSVEHLSRRANGAIARHDPNPETADLLDRARPRFVVDYKDLLMTALHQRIYNTQDILSARVKKMAYELGRFGARPRDAIEIHTHALREQTRDLSISKRQVVVEEGRLLVLTLVGYLAEYYREMDRPRSDGF